MQSVLSSYVDHEESRIFTTFLSRTGGRGGKRVRKGAINIFR